MPGAGTMSKLYLVIPLVWFAQRGKHGCRRHNDGENEKLSPESAPEH